jgi:hypothetical protein
MHKKIFFPLKNTLSEIVAKFSNTLRSFIERYTNHLLPVKSLIILNE